ncbi:hypothetical protein QYE76_070402 [Lolium multiflorum]|uniref:Uncharacterized protein n=1 Tax=Lolium multiflorum TaxID=4521 RepID=A0AAD8SI45_LOLMU|nr:hypothetical protein QYE76_070402 [Lolium multiflorum]
MPMDWEWGFVPLSSTNPPTNEAKERFPRIAAEKRGPKQKRDLHEVDPDPYIHWTDLKMGRTHTSRPDAPSASTQPQVHEHVAPLQDEVGREFLEKLSSQGKKNKAPAPEAGSSQGPPAKRSRTEVVGGKEVGRKRYQKKQMPVASGPVLKLSKSASGPRPESSEGTARTSSPLYSSPVPSGTLSGRHSKCGARGPYTSRSPAEEEHISPPETQDTGASNIGADSEAAGRAEPQDAPDAPSSTKTSSAPPPEAPTVEPTGATPTPPPNQGPSASEPAPSPSQGPAAAKPPPPEGTKLLKPEPFKGKATASGTATSSSQQLALHAGRAAVAAGETATGLLGQITELKRGGHELGHLLEYAERWNRADVSAATRGLGKDRLPAIDPAGPRCSEHHFIRLRRAVRELDNAWHDATNNVVSTADARKRLFEELLWEHRDLSEAHSHCQAIPEASIEALKAQLSTLQGEKEQLIQEHRKALDAQKAITRGLKDELIQIGLRHDQELKDAKAAAEAQLKEALDDSVNSTAVLRAELEEGGKARKAADIGIPNGPAEDSTRGLLKAHYPKNKKIRKPEMLLRKARVIVDFINRKIVDFINRKQRDGSRRRINFIVTLHQHQGKRKLAKIFSDMSFESSADSYISDGSNSVDSYDFIDKSTTVGKVFANLHDGVTKPNIDLSTKYHQIYVIGEPSHDQEETSEAFGDLGNPYVDPSDLR